MNCLQNSDLIAMSAAAIALCALGVSIWQAVLMRRHNILSLKPHLEVHVSTINESYDISIINNGFGPAIINKIYVKLGNSSQDIKCESDYKALVGLFVKNGNLEDYSYLALDDNSAVSSGQKITILSVPIKNNKQEILNKFDESIRKSEIHVEYTSLYEEQYSTSFNGKNVAV